MRTMTPHYRRVRQSTLGTKAQSGAQTYDSKGIAIPQAAKVGRVSHRSPIAHLLTR